MPTAQEDGIPALVLDIVPAKPAYLRESHQAQPEDQLVRVSVTLK